MTYVLATTERKVRWYEAIRAADEGMPAFKLHDILDLDHITVWGDKDSAKRAAVAMGLRTWRYVRI